MKIVAIVLIALIGGAGIALSVTTWRWQSATAALTTRLRATADPGLAALATGAEAAVSPSLPAPLARYLRAAIPAGRGPIREARLHSYGDFFVDDKGWRPFRAVQVFTAEPAGFVWDARIDMAPGLPIFVRDALVGGHASMRGAVWGWMTVVDAKDTPGLVAGSLHRYLAEAVWLPTALIPGHGVSWTAIDDTTARVTLTRGETSVWLDVHFGADQLPSSLETPARAREVGGRVVPTPWRVRLTRYEERSGYRIPVEAEVSWVLPEGPRPYWRGSIGRADYVDGGEAPPAP